MHPSPDFAEQPAAGHTRFYRKIQERLGSTRIRSDQDLVNLVESRLPASAIQSLMRGGLSDNEIYQLVIPRRTLAHRIAKHQSLSQDESDRAVRLARVTALAEQIFAGRDRAWRWMRQNKVRLGGRAPIELLQTEAGARLIEESLYQIDDGMAA